MTRKQAAALAFIAKHIEVYSQPPTIREIANGLGLNSTSGPARLVDALVEHGFIRRLPGRARSIQIIDPGEVKLSAEIFRLVSDYAKQEKKTVDTIANELLRSCFLEASQ